jgi:hypothetical protein
LIVLDEIGVAPLDTRAEFLRKMYARAIRVPTPSMGGAARVRDHEALHYFKAPLVLVHLDKVLKERSAGRKSLRGFLQSNEYVLGRERSIRESLELYSGLDLNALLSDYFDGHRIPGDQEIGAFEG